MCLKSENIFHLNDDSNKHEISVYNRSCINYVMLAEDVKYFPHTPECYAVQKLSIFP